METIKENEINISDDAQTPLVESETTTTTKNGIYRK